MSDNNTTDEPSEYPLGKNPDQVETPTGKTMSDVTLESLADGDVDAADIRISAETLEKQATVAESAGRSQMKQNFQRAAELTEIPDERILEIYNALRPSGAEKETLLEIADELEDEYDAQINAELVREAAEVYETRGLY
ncbi:glycerol dehydrogenase [Haladaptatus sp. R4]|uniref:diol dehydratase small subunit n=1 Tax=Haladaptatus sp. R4 TaxID=1679489 RepID=UPI0007B4EAD6|nr:diol dehydratase small subunit [Haladaptatus sp. R4]KZN22997.1 glycerol dehydrogenase [Haladaptatus sp. R4]